jgi:thiamine monophosphate kinase
MIAAASGGEDYELLACIPQERIESVRAEIGDVCELTEIGIVVEGSGAVLLDESGAVQPVTGFDHLSSN